MANQGAKKRKEENKRHMTNLQRLIIACNVIYFVIRLIFHSIFSWKNWLGLIMTSPAYWFSYQQLANMAKSTYSDEGELMDVGLVMTSGGICSYLHDVIYITCFVQLSSLISAKFLLTYLVIPVFAVYKFFALRKSFLSLQSPNDAEDDEKSQKKREKKEKKAARGKMLRMRNR